MSKRKILVIEDEKDMAFALQLQLEAKDFQVLIAYDGQAGLDMARREMPDLIILDVMLPKINGYRICRMLKFDEKYKHIPIIMFTARAQSDDEKMGLEVGADVYITKPFDAKTLMKKIEKYLATKN